MIFQHTHELVLSGAKSQTRRIATASQRGKYDDGRYFATDNVYFDANKAIQYVASEDWRILYEVGKTYAVCPGRGKKAVGRIQITGIRREDVRNISWDDAIAEGFESPLGFLDVWTRMHDKPMAPLDWGNHVEMLPSRPAEKYQAWVLEFRLVEPVAP